MNNYNNDKQQRRFDILFYIHYCLIGEIPKKLRLASVEWTDQSACLYFYFDGEIEEKDKETLEEVYDNFVANFTEEEMQSCGLDFIRIDEPEPINYKGECFYARKEKYD